MNLVELRFDYSEPQRDMMKNSMIANNILEYGFDFAFDASDSIPKFNENN